MNTIEIFKTFFGFGVAFILLPWLILPSPKSARNTLDVLAINFVRWLGIVMVVAQILAAIRLYETTTMIILALIAIYFFKLRPSGRDGGWFSDLGDRISVRLANLGDRFERGEAQVATRSRAERSAERRSGNGGMRTTERTSAGRLLFMFLLVVPFIVVLVISYYLRVKAPAANVSLSPSDSYTILTWTKLFEQNQIFTEGIYPHGLHAVLSLWHKFSLGLEVSDLIRFGGPLMTTLIPVGALYTVLRITRNAGAAVFAAAVFGIFASRPEFLVPFSRQTAPLPQEFSLGIGLMTLAFVAMAVTTKEKGHLWTVGIGTVAMALVHPLPLFVFLAMAGVLAVGTGLFAKDGLPAAARVIGVTIAAALIGHLYIPIGLLFGKAIFAGIRDLLPFIGSGDAANDFPFAPGAEEFGQNAISIGSLIGALFGFFGGFVMLASKRRAAGAATIGLSAVAVLLFILFDITILGLDAFYAIRIAWIIGPTLAIGYGVGLAGVLAIVPARLGLARVAISMVLGVLAILIFAAMFPVSSEVTDRTPTDYEAISEQTRDIIRSNETFTYTVVGIPEQRQRVLGDGFFVELWVFARDVRVQDAMRPGYELPIATEDVYITIEKEAFPGLILEPTNPTNEYYRDPVKRGRIMAIVYEWAETYRQFHDDMTVYYDDDKVRIYHIERTADFRLADESNQFKNYEWEPGELFNDGPTIEEVLNR